MGEQNRRAVELEPAPAASETPARPPAPVAQADPADDPGHRALGPEADERQTRRQAPDGAAPGESAEGDTIG